MAETGTASASARRLRHGLAVAWRGYVAGDRKEGVTATQSGRRILTRLGEDDSDTESSTRWVSASGLAAGQALRYALIACGHLTALRICLQWQFTDDAHDGDLRCDVPLAHHLADWEYVKIARAMLQALENGNVETVRWCANRWWAAGLGSTVLAEYSVWPMLTVHAVALCEMWIVDDCLLQPPDDCLSQRCSARMATRTQVLSTVLESLARNSTAQHWAPGAFAEYFQLRVEEGEEENRGREDGQGVQQPNHIHRLLRAAVRGRSLPIVEFLTHRGAEPTCDELAYAALGGRADILQWLVEKTEYGDRLRNGGAPVRIEIEDAIGSAISLGREEALQYLLSDQVAGNFSWNHCATPATGSQAAVPEFLDTLNTAVMAGHTGVLELVFDWMNTHWTSAGAQPPQPPQAPITEWAINTAAANNHLAVVAFLHQQPNQVRCTEYALRQARSRGLDDMVALLERTPAPSNKNNACVALPGKPNV